MRFGIQKKLLLLIVLLSFALIIVSVIISSQLYSASLERSMRETCRESAVSLVDNIETMHDTFLSGYKKKIEKVYLENREELELVAEEGFESYDKREEYYNALTAGVFPPKNGFGLSYEMAVFNGEYQRLRDDMDILSYAGGLDHSALFFYDAEHGSIVYLIDRQPEGSALYNFPASIVKPTDKKLVDALESGAGGEFISDELCIAVRPVSGVSGDIFVMFAKKTADIKESVKLFSLYTFGILLGATLVIGLVMLLFAKRLIVDNIKKLSSASERFTSQIGGGMPEKVAVSISSKDEIGDLSDKFGLMQDSILGYIGTLAEKTSKEEKMNAELELAARIQAESLPKGGLKKGAYELTSFLKPAREVGGDLYDYFMLDDKRMFFCLADVSGKGVPASLFMMRAKELIRAHIVSDDTLAGFAYKLNNDLCAGNEESIFITAFFGVLDISDGRLSYLRAGHEQPVLRRGGEVTRLSDESNCVLGVFEDMEYSADEVVLQPGDVLLMFTDGLNEGINEREEAFGYDRIDDTLKKAEGDINSAMYEALCSFCGVAQQFDDVTMLTLAVDRSKRIELDHPCCEDIRAVTDAVLKELSGFDKDRVSEVGIIIDEIMNNQISYAFAETERPHISVALEKNGSEAALTFEDNGAPFDPTSDVTGDQLELSEGGFGLGLVKAVSDVTRYERTDGINRLTVIKNMRP